MVLATHGRSFWILDDLSPLRQAPTAADAVLFAPAPKIRLRTYRSFGGWGSSYGPDVVNYGGIGTSVVGFTTTASSDEPAFLNAGTNPPEGIVFQYYLPDASDDAVRSTFACPMVD